MFDLLNRDEKAFNEDEILVTLEFYNKVNNLLLFDFINFKHYSRFNELINNTYLNDDNGPSMFLVKNFSDKRKFKEGTYYNINKAVLTTLVNQILIEEDSLVIRYVIDLKKEGVSALVIKSIITASFIKNSLQEDLGVEVDGLAIDLPTSINDKRKLIVRNVGQGSWNEFLINGQPKVVFDIGTSYTEKKANVKRIMSQRDTDYQSSQPIVILSHWDVDHYHLLLEAEDETIKSIRVFLHRFTIPNQTSQRLINRFKTLNSSALMPIDIGTPPAPQKTSDELAQLITFGGDFQIYNGYKNANRNKSGLLLTFISNKIVVVCGADFHYSQINDYVLPKLRFTHNHYLIVPHHGGEAGKVVYTLNEAKFKDAVISVGKNSYNHPFQYVKDDLKK